MLFIGIIVPVAEHVIFTAYTNDFPIEIFRADVFFVIEILLAANALFEVVSHVILN
jgi:hypothetical protein